ncbi:MAG TPA: bifunctional riboflavin kinase/FAD synthetase [Beijerinckiaceae bacterium]|nr:bifunctional riboflavin kinase/FAD synthetase [Beijerinckiaceae bacterium]
MTRTIPPDVSGPAPGSPVLLRDPSGLPETLAGPVVAIGNFDGLHRGHKHVIGRAGAMAARLGRPLAILTFDPHPRAYFQPDVARFRLSAPRTQAMLAATLGVDALIVLTFDAALAGLSAEAFVREVLVGRLGVAGVVAGADFHYGSRRSGSPETLRAAGARFGFAVEIVDQVAEGAMAVSSTRIREALAAGDIAAANAMLGHEWFVSGPVIHGQKLGRTLGFPTANLALDAGCGLRHGIYAVRVAHAGNTYGGVASFGRRPTVDNGPPLLEVVLFDFSGDLYGQMLTVAFLAFLRPEEKFDSLDALVAQMNRDAEKARAIVRQTKI